MQSEIEAGQTTQAKKLPFTCARRRPPLWSGGQEFLATDPEARVRFPALPEKKISSCSMLENNIPAKKKRRKQ
jgi:hypothetical protein